MLEVETGKCHGDGSLGVNWIAQRVTQEGALRRGDTDIQGECRKTGSCRVVIVVLGPRQGD